MSEVDIAYPEGCITALLVRREKRFIVIAEQNGEIIKAHTNNTGSMLGLLRPGSRILLSPANNPKRKLAWTWELASIGGFWVGINTSMPNRLLKTAYERRLLEEFKEYDTFKSESKIGNSRLDAKLTGPSGNLWVECKNVTLVEDEIALFPDAITERGQKHLRELMDLAGRGERVALFFLVQRPDAKCFGPADMIDPAYAELFYQAMDAGVEVWPHEAIISMQGVKLGPRLPIVRP